MDEGFTSLRDIINKEPAFEGLRKMIKQSDVVTGFSIIFPDLEKIATAVKVDKNILYLRVENPAWRSELKFKEKFLIENINKHFKEEVIKYIKFAS